MSSSSRQQFTISLKNKLSRISNRQTKRPPALGFSLLELLVVMAIIVILCGMGVMAFNAIGRGGSVRGAVDVGTSLATAARIEAMSHGLGAELVIDNGTNAETKWRRLAVFRIEPDPSNATNTLTNLAGRPTLLPNGVFFLTNYASGYTTNTTHTLSGSQTTPTLVFKFNGVGHLENPGRLIFGGGMGNPDGTVTIPEALKAGMRGFMLPRNGRPMHYQTVEQILSASQP